MKNKTNNIYGAASVEAAFRIPGFRGLHVSADNWENKASSFLAHVVARNPGDLHAHVQRINLAVRHKQVSVLYGALLDLFIALGEQGYALRKRMFDHTANLLEEKPKQFLSASLKTHIKATDAFPDQGVSVLAKGFSGVHELVEEINQAAVGNHDALAEASEYIEFSQLNEAQQVLEKAMLEDSSSEEQQQLLLEIYKKTNNKERFYEVYSTFDIKPDSAGSAWQTMAEYFGVNHV